MKTTQTILLCAAMAALPHAASALVLDFSSGQYNSANTSYTEDGFSVQASQGFHTVKLGTLAWYQGNNIITITSNDAAFDIDQLTIVDRAFAGLVFQSSKGGSLSVGSISGLLKFTGDEWHSIHSLTISTITHTDILNEIDNIVLTSSVPEPSSAMLMLLGLAAISLPKLKKLSQHRI